MTALLVYTKDYHIQGEWHTFGHTVEQASRPSGNGAEKRKNPWEWRYATARNPITEWLAKSPATPEERAQLWEQLAPAYAALSEWDFGAAVEAVARADLSLDGIYLAEHNARDLMNAIRAKIPWDLQDPATRGPFPYVWPDDNTNSGTNSGTGSGTDGGSINFSAHSAGEPVNISTS